MKLFHIQLNTNLSFNRTITTNSTTENRQIKHSARKNKTETNFDACLWTDLSESQTATIADWWQKNDFIAHEQIWVIYLKKSINFIQMKQLCYLKCTKQHCSTHTHMHTFWFVGEKPISPEIIFDSEDRISRKAPRGPQVIYILTSPASLPTNHRLLL